MNVRQKHGPFFAFEASANDGFALASPAVDERARVTWVVQDAQHTTVLQRRKDQFTRAYSCSDSSGPQNAFRPEVMDDAHSGARSAKRLEQQTHRLLDLLIRIQHDSPTMVINEADRWFHPQFATPRFVKLSAD